MPKKTKQSKATIKRSKYRYTKKRQALEKNVGYLLIIGATLIPFGMLFFAPIKPGNSFEFTQTKIVQDNKNPNSVKQNNPVDQVAREILGDKTVEALNPSDPIDKELLVMAEEIATLKEKYPEVKVELASMKPQKQWSQLTTSITPVKKENKKKQEECLQRQPGTNWHWVFEKGECKIIMNDLDLAKKIR